MGGFLVLNSLIEGQFFGRFSFKHGWLLLAKLHLTSGHEGKFCQLERG